MFKAIAIGLALFVGAQSIKVNHQDAVNVDSLTDIQKSADAFFRSKIPNLSSTKLSNGDQSGNDFTFQYVSQNTPITLTQTKATLIDQGQKLFKLMETTQSLTGPVNGGRLTSIKKTYGVDSFDQAMTNLGWK